MSQSTNRYSVAILGATGAVGRQLARLLEERVFPIKKLYLLASEQSAGETIKFKKKPRTVVNAAEFDFKKAQICLFSAGRKASAQYAPKAVEAGCVVIDNTSEFRYEKDIPLVVPEVNAEAIVQYENRRIIANPNCSTIQLVVALKPIYEAVGIKRVNVATYQSVSGMGASGINRLANQTAQLLNGEIDKADLLKACKNRSELLAFNVVPHIDCFEENGYTREEMKLVWETRKILGDPALQVNPTAVRVPTFYCHAEAVHIETKKKLNVDEACRILRTAKGIVLLEGTEYPMPFTESAQPDAVYIGRVRKDISHPKGLNLWVVSDNLRKGAALNAVQIAEILVENHWH